MAALRAAVRQAHAIPEPNRRRASTADRWRTEIEEAIAKGVGPQALYDRLRREKVEGLCSLSALKRLHLPIRREKGPRPQDVAIPVISDPGDIALVDSGYVGKLYDSSTGKVRKAWVFVMVLGHSRHLFARVVFEQMTHTWLELHVAAFRWFGGVPRTVVPDNLKAAVIRAAFGLSDRNELASNRSYCELARFYGFKIDPTPAYAPKKKGKVESAVKHVKSNFIAAAGLETLDEVNDALREWV